VFYIPDLVRKNWCVVMPGKKKNCWDCQCC
jgi:hypothetical protein